MLELYYFSASFYSQKVLLALAEREIPVTKHIVNIGAFENYSEWFMKINPKGQVPVLVDNGKIISDSADIIQYLDDTYGGVRLMPDHGREKWSHFQHLCEDIKVKVLTYGAAISPEFVTNSQIPGLVQRKMRSAVLHGTRTDRIKEMMEANPHLADLYGQKLKDWDVINSEMKDKNAVIKERKKVKSLLCEVEQTLCENKEDWLCGPDITVADICLAVLLQRMTFCGYSSYLWGDNQLPLVAAYYERLLRRKTFHEVCVKGSSKMTMLRFIFGGLIHSLFTSTTGAGVLVVVTVMLGLYFYNN